MFYYVLIYGSRWVAMALALCVSLLPGGHPNIIIAAWFQRLPGWEMYAFQGFGAMSGFSLASLGLIATLAGHPRARGVIDENRGRAMLHALLLSVWAWLLPALLALATIAIPAPDPGADAIDVMGWAAWRWVPFVATAAFGMGQGVGALAALHLFFGRFVLPKPSSRILQ